MLKKLGVLLILLGLALGGLLLTSADSRFVAEASLAMPYPPAAVYARLAAVGEWPRWWPGVEAASLAPGWQPGAELQITLKGDPEQEPAVVDETSPDAALSWQRPGVLGSRTRTRFALQPAGEATLVQLRSEIHGPQAVLARWTARGDFIRYQELVLSQLKQRLEQDASGGEQVQP